MSAENGGGPICPLMSRVQKIDDDPEVPADFAFHPVPCQRHKCALWIKVYSTENILQGGDCAIALGPQMNADGLFVV